MRELGCGHRLAPVLERFDKIDGVTETSVNHTGTLLRFDLNPRVDEAQTAAAIEIAIKREGTAGRRISGERAANLLKAEKWRSKDRLLELSAIEFRTLALQTVSLFSDEQKLDALKAATLARLAETGWDGITEAARQKDKNLSPLKIDWRARAKEFAKGLKKQTKEILNGEQQKALDEMLNERAEWLPTAK